MPGRRTLRSSGVDFKDRESRSANRDDDLATLTHGFAGETLDDAYTYNKIGQQMNQGLHL